MSEMRALTNLVGNGVATLVVAKWENELNPELARKVALKDGEDSGKVVFAAAVSEGDDPQ